MTFFTPYHNFQALPRYERCIQTLYTRGSIPETLYINYQRYHWALIYKLRCAKHHLDRLNDLLTTAEIQDATNPDFTFPVNMSIDGFFYAGGSALDILARELIVVFGDTLPAKVYFHTARNVISSSHPGDTILSRLADPSWLTQFKLYRNSLTHELIIASDYSIRIRQQGATTSHEIIIPLPDDPREIPGDRTFRLYPDIRQYLRDRMRTLLSFVNTIYSDLRIRIESASSLPL